MCECFWRLFVAFFSYRHLLSLFGIHVFCFVSIKICINIIIIIKILAVCIFNMARYLNTNIQ